MLGSAWALHDQVRLAVDPAVGPLSHHQLQREVPGNYQACFAAAQHKQNSLFAAAMKGDSTVVREAIVERQQFQRGITR